MHFWIDSKKLNPLEYYKFNYHQHKDDKYLIAMKDDSGDVYYDMVYFTNYFHDNDYDMDYYNIFYNYITTEYGSCMNILNPDYWTTIKNPYEDKFVLP